MKRQWIRMLTRNKYGYLLMAILSGYINGCGMLPLEEPVERSVQVEDAMGNTNPYPCVSVGAVATTPWHMYEDPLKTPYSQFSVHHIDIVSKDGDKIWTSPYRVGMGFVFMMRHQKCDEIIFVPGFNPEGLIWSVYDITDNTSSSQPDFWWEYYKEREKNILFDADYRCIENLLEIPNERGESLVISLIPLYGINPASGIRRNLVNHSLLVWLLERKDLWSDLRGFYRKKDSKEGVRLAAETVRQMVEAHEERWPEYPWTKGQKKIIEWCREVAAGETEN